MRLLFATIVAASATLATLSSPALADGERGYGHHHDNRGGGRDGGGNWNGGNRSPGNDDTNRDNNQDNGRDNGRYDRRYDGRQNDRYDDRRGSTYWGPSARQWSSWDNNWGDPNRYARQWGFDRYDPYRGWQRGNTWYTSPNLWSDWGGWNWSFSWGNNAYANNYYNNGYSGYGGNQCLTYRTQDWINGRRALVTYVGCQDRYGRIVEQPGTRRIERWVW
jgi:hypothetical protein